MALVLLSFFARAQSLTATTKCPWRAPQEDFTANQPVVSFYDVEAACPAVDNGAMFTDICASCDEKAAGTKDGEYMICYGCSQERSAIATLMQNDICGYIKDQTKDVALQEAAEDDEIQEYIGPEPGSPVIIDATGMSGEFSATCDVKPDTTSLNAAPAVRLNFDCGPCVNTGVPKLGKKCCEACKLFSEERQRWTQIMPYVACLGCDKEKVEVDGKEYPVTHDFHSFREKFSMNAAERRLENHMCAPVKKLFDKMSENGRHDRRLQDPVQDYDPNHPTACEQLGAWESDAARSFALSGSLVIGCVFATI